MSDENYKNLSDLQKRNSKDNQESFEEFNFQIEVGLVWFSSLLSLIFFTGFFFLCLYFSLISSFDSCDLIFFTLALSIVSFIYISSHSTNLMRMIKFRIYLKHLAFLILFTSKSLSMLRFACLQTLNQINRQFILMSCSGMFFLCIVGYNSYKNYLTRKMKKRMLNVENLNEKNLHYLDCLIDTISYLLFTYPELDSDVEGNFSFFNHSTREFLQNKILKNFVNKGNSKDFSKDCDDIIFKKISKNFISNLKIISPNKVVLEDFLDCKSSNNQSIFEILKHFKKISSNFKNFVFLFIGIVEYKNIHTAEVFYFKLFMRKIEMGGSSWVEIMMYDISSVKELEVVDQTITLKEKILSKIAHEFKTPLICVIALAEEIYNNLKVKLKTEENSIIRKKIRHVRDLSNYTLYLISDIAQYLNRNSQSFEMAYNHQENNTDNYEEHDFLGNENRPISEITPVRKINPEKKNTPERKINPEIKIFNRINNPEKNNKKLTQNIQTNDERKNLKLNYEEVNLLDILKFCYRILKTLLIYNKNKISFIKPQKTFDKELRKVKIQTDPLRLKQILLNLISNSVKFTQSGSITLIAKKDDQNSCIKLGVSDTGVGIKSKDLHKVFKDYKMLDEHKSLNFLGTGLGLSISLNLADLLGYQLRVNSQTGEGSYFYLNINYENLSNADFLITKTKSPVSIYAPKIYRSSLKLKMSILSNAYFNNEYGPNEDFSKKKYITSKTLKGKGNHINVDNLEGYSDDKKNSNITGETVKLLGQVNESFEITNNSLYRNNYDSSKKIRNPNFSLFQKQEEVPPKLLLQEYEVNKENFNSSNFPVNNKIIKMKRESSVSSLESSKTIVKYTVFDYNNLKRLKSKFGNPQNLQMSSTNNTSSLWQANRLVTEKFSSSSDSKNSSSDSNRNSDRNVIFQRNGIIEKKTRKNSKILIHSKSQFSPHTDDSHKSNFTHNIILNNSLLPVYTILIIDDNTLILNYLENLLLKILQRYNVNNYKVVRGMDGVDMIKCIIDDQKNRNLIKCVFIDENMEFINGSEAIKIYKKLEESNKVKSVKIVRFTSEEEKEPFKSLDFTLSKPPKKRDVVNLLKLFKIIF